MARRLGLPVRTWYNYEAGVTVPAEVLLRFVELTAVEPIWLLHGKGPKYRAVSAPLDSGGSSSVPALLRRALERLDAEAESSGSRISIQTPSVNGSMHAIDVEEPQAMLAHHEWLDAERDNRCIQVQGEAMVPVLAKGARVAYAADQDDPQSLDGKLVVAWPEGTPVVRWFACSGRYGLLRAENSAFDPVTILIDLQGPPAQRRLHRVTWTSTPH
ncbi:MAG: XRE family transcriptional regulator [Isosphaeraceae bacterium]